MIKPANYGVEVVKWGTAMAAAVFLISCGASTSEKSTADGAIGDASMSSDARPGADLFAVAPTLIDNPSGKVPLAAELRFQLDDSYSPSVEIDDGERRWQIPSGLIKHNNGNYSIPIVGMKPDQVNDVRLSIEQDGISVYETMLKHRTPPLPDNQLKFPPIAVERSVPEKMEPGVTFLSIRRRYPLRGHWMTPKQLSFSMGWGMLVALDAAGDVIWFYESDSRTAGIDRLANGNIVMHRADFSTVEIDLLGNTVRQFYAENRPAGPPDNPYAIPIKGQQTLHHQPHELPDGNFLAFSANGEFIEDYPTSELDPSAPKKDQMVMADTIVIFDKNGQKLWSWDTMDYLDPYRIGYDTFWSYWWTRGFNQHADWTHGNGLSYNADDDSILVSLRNQLAILKIDRATKDLVWILGRHDNWPLNLQDKLLKPVGEDFLWFGYQHNPRYTPDGTVILFDNRANGARMPFEPRPPWIENFSRAVEYRIDETNMTVEQIWSTGDRPGDDPCFTNAMSEAWKLPKTGNRLVIHAYCLPLIEGLTEDIMDPTKRAGDDLPFPGGPILEFAGDEIVFEARVQDPDDLIQWEVYGGFRSPAIYLEASTHNH